MKKGIGCGSIILIIIALIFIGSFAGNNSTDKEATRLTKSEQQKQNQYVEEKTAFDEAIGQHYSELIQLMDEKQFDAALDKISLFSKYGNYAYKDIGTIYKKAKTQVLDKKVKKLPASDIEGNLDIYRELLRYNPDNQRYKNKVEHYQKKWDKHEKEEAERRYKASCKLELLGHGWHEEYSYAVYEGQVKNISNSKMEHVQAVVTWYDNNGNMITSRSALIEYDPLMPGQTSPFKVIKSFNPAMQKAGVEFSYLMGGLIQTFRK